MWFIIKKRLLWILKNPIYYIGAILVLLLTYNMCHSYLEIHYYNSDSKIEDVPVEYLGDADIMNGYIPMTEEERFEDGLEDLKQDLIQSVGIEEKQVSNLIDDIKGLDTDAAIKFIKEKYPYLGNVEGYFYVPIANKKATVEEANSYIKQSLEKEDYTDYFGRKYSDFLGVGIVFYCLIIFAFFYNYDYKKDIYELLHTKPILEWKYILAKALSGILAISLVVAIITISSQVLLMINRSHMNIPISTLSTFKIWKYVLVCNMPIICYISFFYLFISGLFNTPLPAIPILFLQLLYSNYGVKNENGMFHYMHKPGSILIRFPEAFFETKLSNMQYINQGILIILTIVIACFAIFQWKRKRVW